MRELSNLLQREDRVETTQRLNNGININDMGLRYGPDSIPKIPKDSFFSHTYVSSTKQHRYSYMPAHTHSFIELNYQYSGRSNQILNGQPYTLTPGMLLVMDRDIIQKYGYMGKTDLLVNILLDIDTLPNEFIADIPSAKDFSRFLYTAQTPNISHENFIIYNLNNHSQVKRIWEDLILYSLTETQPYLTRGILLKAAISCLPQPIFSNLHILKSTHDSIHEIIHYIDTHYDSVTLDNLSQHFGYNKNYLGNKIKSYTELSFGELLDRKRLLTAEGMLLDTALSIDAISEKLGYKNPSSLFRLFSNKVHLTPTEFREQHANELN